VHHLVKCPYTEEVCVRKCRIDWVCPNCHCDCGCDQGMAPAAPSAAPMPPAPPSPPSPPAAGNPTATNLPSSQALAVRPTSANPAFGY
jgi:hypothetical protein